MCAPTSDAHCRCISEGTDAKENEMFPANEMIMAAEVAYRRERMVAVRPSRRSRRARRARARTRRAETTRTSTPGAASVCVA